MPPSTRHRATPPPGPVRSVALYVRVSTEDQADRGASLDGQRTEALAWLAARDLTLAGEWSDVLSGKRADRPGYRAMLAARATYDAVLVWRLDRLGRDEAEFFSTLAELRRTGRDVLSVTEPNGSPVITGILAVLAADESRRLGERSRMGLDQRAREGKWGSNEPYGYDWRDGALVINPTEAAVLLEAVGLAESGWTLRRICAHLMARAIPGPAGGAWYVSSLARVLRSPLPAGLIPHRGDLLPAAHEAIIDRARWEALVARLDAPGRGRGRGTWSGPGHLLTGLLRCAGCGATMVACKSRNGAYYYRCRRRATLGPEACAMGLWLPLSRADEIVTAAMLRPVDAVRTPRPANRDAARRAERERLTRRVAAADRELVGLTRMRARDELTAGDYAAARAACLAQRDAATTDLAALPDADEPDAAARAAMLVMVRQSAALWSRATVDEQRGMLGRLGCRATWDGATLAVDWSPAVAGLLGRCEEVVRVAP